MSKDDDPTGGTQDPGASFDERFNVPPASGGNNGSDFPDWMLDALKAPPSMGDQEGDDEPAAADEPTSTGKPDPLEQRFLQLGEESDRLHKEKAAKVGAGIEEVQGMQKDLAGLQQPELGQQPDLPKGALVDGAYGFIQIATALAAIAGGVGRRGGTIALTAFGAAIKGFTQGRLQDYQANMDKWKEASQKMALDNKTKLEAYDRIYRAKEATIEQKIAAIKLVAMQYQDEITYNLAEQGRLVNLGQFHFKQGQMQIDLENKIKRGIALDQQIDEHADKMKELDQDSTDIAKGIAEGRIPPDQMGSYSVKNRVAGKLQRMGFDRKAAEASWLATKKSIQTMGGPQVTKVRILARTTDRQIERVKQLASQLKQSGFPIVNSADLWKNMNINTNSPQGQLTTEYISALASLKEDFAGLSQGGYSPTEPAWKLADQQVNAAYGSDQMMAALSEIQRTIRFREKTYVELDPLHRELEDISDIKENPAPATDADAIAAAKKRLGIQ